MEQQRERVKYASKHQDEKWQEIMDRGTGRFWIHSHGNQQATGQGQENTAKANKLLIWNIQYRQN